MLKRIVSPHLGGLLVPPDVATLLHGDLGTSSSEDEDVLGDGALLECGIGDGLCRDGLSAALGLVGGDEDLGLAVVDAVSERLGGEAGKDDRVDGSQTSAGEEGYGCFWDHGQVDGNGLWRRGWRTF